MNIEDARRLLDVVESELEIYNQASYDFKLNKIEICNFMNSSCPEFLNHISTITQYLDSLDKIQDPNEMILIFKKLINQLLDKKKTIDSKINFNFEMNIQNGRRWRKKKIEVDDSSNSDGDSAGKCITEKDKKIPKNDSLAH